MGNIWLESGYVMSNQPDARERLARLSEASLSINEGLDLEIVLQRVLDSARSLTGADYGVMTTVDESGRVEEFLASGLTPEEAQQLWEMPGGSSLLEYLDAIPGPMRVADFAVHTSSKGLPEFRPPAPMGAFLTVPVRHRGVRVGNVHMARSRPGEEFSRGDEETLVMFASQAALAIANARRYREEQRARTALETLVDTSPVGVAVFDAGTGEPALLNREMARIADSLREADQPRERILGVLTCRRADGREVSLREWPLAEVLSEGETVRAEEIVLSVPDGRSVSALLNATPIRGDGGDVESFLVTLQDMTPLEEPERMRAEFLGMVSHELRTPLISIRGSATTMLESASDLDPVELRQFLRIIVGQADNMRELIDDLLDVARIEAGTLPVDPEPTELAPLVDRAKSTFLSGGGRDNLDIDLAPDLPLVMADRRRVVQVIGNLLANAARHSPEHSAIRVLAVRDGVDVAVSVADGGRGIPSEQLSRMFRKFSGDEAGDRGADSGLGLAICKGIVEAHGGRIWAESDGPGLGARFTFTVPAAEGAVGFHAPPAPSLRGAGEGEPILVVDDDPHTLRHVRKALSGAGYEAEVTADPDEALTLMAEGRPRLVLLDMMLPGAYGIDLMGDILSIADVPVVFLSAYGHDEMIARAFEMGAADYIVKPFTPTELVARVRAALRRREGSLRSDPSEPYVLGDLTIDYEARLVSVGGRPLRLTAKEYDLLRALSIGAGQVLTHDQLLRRVWGAGKRGNVRTLRTHLRRLRVKLGDSAADPKYIRSEPRVGYRMAGGEVRGR